MHLELENVFSLLVHEIRHFSLETSKINAIIMRLIPHKHEFIKYCPMIQNWGHFKMNKIFITTDCVPYTFHYLWL